VIGLTYDQSALAAGDSRNFFFFTALRASVQTAFFLVGAEIGGMTGALVGQGIAGITVYPFLIRLARRHGAWDPLHDGIFFSVGYLLGAVALWLHHDKIALLAQLVAP
jgi:hypothetical protein